jgi:chemotaxis protein MotB
MKTEFDFSEFEEHEEQPESDSEIWLVSYADMMTLLFGFFVLMYVFASQQTAATTSMKQKLAEQFGGRITNHIREQSDQLRKEIQSIPELADVDVREDAEGVTITFRTAVLFASGSSSLSPQAEATLQVMLRQIREHLDAPPIVVEGHTDDRALISKQFLDNWELSAARAAAVVRIFEKAGIESSHLSAVGLGASRPLAPNRDVEHNAIEKNMELNRRVVLHILLANPAKSSPEKSEVPTSEKSL